MCVAVVAVWWPVLSAAEPILSGDLVLAFDRATLQRTFLDFWNPSLEFPNVETIDRAAFMAPFALLDDPVDLQRWLLATVLLGAGVAMFAAARRLGAPVVLACLVAVAYAVNPWVAVRVQHVFLLPGYALLPLVVAWTWRPPRHGSVALMVAALSLGAATPHTAAALWAMFLVALVASRGSWTWRRSLAVAAWYGLVNLYWIVPAVGFVVAVGLAPSWPTWEMVETFSRRADLAAVWRLDGYWWPMADVAVPSWAAVLGLALVPAALLAWLRPDRRVLALSVLALVLSVTAVGAHAPWWSGPLVVQGPVADRLGWLFRDPNKAVGALAGVLLLLVALAGRAERRVEGRVGRARAVPWLAGAGVAAYLVFAVPYVGAYAREAYRGHPLPAALGDVQAWLREEGGRSTWQPGYYGGRTFWNGDLATPEVLVATAPGPVLAPYAYDERAINAFLTLDHGAVLGDLDASPSALMRRWDVRWLVHHRDLLPLRSQPPGGFDARVELRSLRLVMHGLREAWRADPFTVYEVDGVGRGPTVVAAPLLTARATAAAAVLSRLAEVDEAALVDAPHSGVRGVFALPGDEPRLLLAAGAITVDLPAAAPHALPEQRWSRYLEASPAWWPRLAERHGPAPTGSRGVIATARAGAVLEVAARAPVGRYRLVVRGYEGVGAGRVTFDLGDGAGERAAELVRPTARMAWHDLGDVEVTSAEAFTIRIVNVFGLSVVGDLSLVPAAAWTGAAARLLDMDVTWAWPAPAHCLAPATGAGRAGPGTALVIDPQRPANLPLDVGVSGGLAWSDVAYMELTIHVDAPGGAVEVWTPAEGTWVWLGTVDAWWQGRRTVLVPIDAGAFWAAPASRALEASLVRLVLADGSAPPDPPQVAPQLVAGRLVEAAPCRFELGATLQGPFDVTLVQAGGGSSTLGLGGPSDVVVGTGVDATEAWSVGVDQAGTLEFVDGLPADTELVVVHRPGAVAGAASTVSVGCPDDWRLVRTGERYVEGLQGRVDGVTVEGVAVDGLMAGFWLPPNVCGDLEIVNPWRALGRWTSLVSAVAALGLLVGSLRSRS